jgi:hypothetical protein
MAGGVDTQAGLEYVAHACGVQLPRVLADGTFVSLMWSGGVHSPPDANGCTSPPGGLPGFASCSNAVFHYHQNFTNLYDVNAAGHSPKIGVTTATAVAVVPIYGKWERAGVAPALDACGAHFGTTPESPATAVYHHHVQERAPFTVGCYGPNADGGEVTLAQCRSYYSTCGDDVTSLTTSSGVMSYDLFCPCYDSVTGSNVPAGAAVTNGTVTPTAASSTPTVATTTPGSTSAAGGVRALGVAVPLAAAAAAAAELLL